MIDFPVDDKSVSFVWDGETLHATHPVNSDRPVHFVIGFACAIPTSTASLCNLTCISPVQTSQGQDGKQVDPQISDDVLHFQPTFDQGAGE